MHPKWLKYIRRSISIMFLLAFALIFLDFTTSIPEKFVKSTTYLQFIPSLLKFIQVPVLLVFGFMVVLVLTMLFGRVYCSTVCPLGILQDVISWVRRRFQSKRKRRYAYSKPLNILRYSLLGITALSLLLGSITLTMLLDPYSIFGRIFSDLFRPIVVLINNGASTVLQKQDIFWLYHLDLAPFHISVTLISVFFLGLVLWLSLRRGRLYCNTVCPVGTLLGWLSKYALYKVRIDKNTCTSCTICQRGCKSECIDMATRTVDNSRCVTCFNCLTGCPFDSIKFTPKLGFAAPTARAADESTAPANTKKTTATPASPRRKFFQTAMATAAALPLLSKAQQIVSHSATVPVNRKTPVSPPGSEEIDRFNDACTACHLCVSVCPTQVLQPAVSEYGLAHFMQPRMDYFAGYCNYDCTKCGEVCPTGAILKLTEKTKKRTQIGTVRFVQENCIVETEGTDCGACAERCPTKAVYMVEHGKLFLPETNEDICIGCGACEYSCPTQPYKAIYVEGTAVHVQADKPKEEKIIEEESEEDFPF